MALSWSDKQRFCQYLSYLALALLCVGIGWSVYYNSISGGSHWSYPPAASTQPISSIGVQHLLLPRYTLSTELELEADHQRLLIQSYMIDRLRMETRRTQRKELSQRYVQQRRQQRNNGAKDTAATGSNSADDPDDTTDFEFPDDDALLNSSHHLTDWTALLDSQRETVQPKPRPAPVAAEEDDNNSVIVTIPMTGTPAALVDDTAATEPQLTIPKIVQNPQEPILPVDLSNADIIEAKPAAASVQPQPQEAVPSSEAAASSLPVLDELTIPKIESPSVSTSADTTTVEAEFLDTQVKSAPITSTHTPIADEAPDTPFNFLTLSPEEVTKHPELCYAYRPKLVQTDDGPGVKVKISVNEQCFPDGIPLSYFRVHTAGTGFTAANPPIAIGPRPLSVPFAYTPYVNATYTPYEGPTKVQKDTPIPSHTTSVEVFLLLPDHGAYHLHVRLQLFNMSIEAMSRSYWFMFSLKKDELEKMQGEWIDRPVYDTDHLRGVTTIPTEGSDVKNFTRIDIPRDWPSPFALEQIYKLPLCGTEIKEKGVESGVSPITGMRYGVGDLSGRWSVSRRTSKGELFDPTQFPSHLLITSAIWRPYFCQLDFTFKPQEGLNKMRWIHFIGDSNSRSMFDTLCSSARGKLAWSPSIDSYMDPPQMCFGPKAMKEGWTMASDHKRVLTTDEYATEEREKYANFDEVIAAEKALNGTNGQWILTFTSWFFGKETIWTPESTYREQCRAFQSVSQNSSTNLYPGWPACEMIGDWIDDLAGPGLIWHSWGSHHLEKAYENYAMQQMLFDIYRKPFHMTSHMMFPLSTAENPSLIPQKFGKQFRLRNNERVQLNNILVSHAVRQWTKQGYYGSLTKYRDPFQSPNEYYKAPESMWLPLLDAFSPTHAAYEVLNYDTVHFEPFFMRFWGRILLHYIKHSPNYGPIPATKNPAGATTL